MNKAFIKFRLYQLEMSQKKLAEDIKTDYSHLNKIINGKTDVRLSTLVKLATALKCTLNDLV